MSRLDDVPRPAAGAGGELRTALLTALGCVLLAAPVGLAWAAWTPRVRVTVVAGGVRLAESTPSAFVAADGYFLAGVAVAGALTGILALLLGRRHGVGSVLGLAGGGLLAAEVARRTGELVGLEEARAFVRSGREGTLELSVRLRSWPALAGWPVAALVVHMLGTALSRPPEDRPGRPLSSG